MIICQPPDGSDTLSPAILGAVIAFIATVSGVGLTEYVGQKRARRREELEWNGRFFDKYADAYRDFLADWNGSNNPVLLERVFLELQSKALVPSDIVREYELVLAEMMATSDAEVRKGYALRLRTRIDNALSDPVGLSKG